MGNVPKSRRQKSKFHTNHNLYKLKKELMDLVMNDFGYRYDKTEEKIQKYYEKNKDLPNIDEKVAYFKQRNEYFYNTFIKLEQTKCINLISLIQQEFSTANSIFPSDTPARFIEYIQRRIHMNSAIGYCYTLKQELKFIIETLPTDKNKAKKFNELIDSQIKLIKGVRRADNRFIRPNKNDRTIEMEILNISNSLQSISYNLLKSFEKYKTENIISNTDDNTENDIDDDDDKMNDLDTELSNL